MSLTHKSLLSALTIAAVGLGSKAFLNLLCADVNVVGLPRLLAALSAARRAGVLTGERVPALGGDVT